ncbi:hypothetical protein FGB62_6g33 [Gracilaria domingensis]|nr:hypothetical protein FGB62_6g33 [Gracilaria domingensis]
MGKRRFSKASKVADKKALNKTTTSPISKGTQPTLHRGRKKRLQTKHRLQQKNEFIQAELERIEQDASAKQKEKQDPILKGFNDLSGVLELGDDGMAEETEDCAGRKGAGKAGANARGVRTEPDGSAETTSEQHGVPKWIRNTEKRHGFGKEEQRKQATRAGRKERQQQEPEQHKAPVDGDKRSDAEERKRRGKTTGGKQATVQAGSFRSGKKEICETASVKNSQAESNIVTLQITYRCKAGKAELDAAVHGCSARHPHARGCT